MSNTVHATVSAAIKSAKHTAAAPLTWDPTNHLLARFTFGPTASSRAYVQKHGAGAWYQRQLELAATYRGYDGNSHVAAQGPLLSMSPYDVREWLKEQGDEYGWDAMDQLTLVTLGLQAWSSAQLYETLVDFFSNHLNVPNHNGDVWNTRHAYDRDVIRQYATGSFTDMLLASAKHPAMLIYLSLADSTKTAVNENYGRELLELHTVGLNYTEDDVKNAAKLLTGRTIDDNMHYLFDDYIHGTGPVQVLGFTHPNSTATGGENAGDDLVRYLAAHPDTAQHLARKLCVRYVSDNPSTSLVNAVAKAYTDNHTQILPMVSTILRSTEFWESRGKKVRRPTENLLATIRVLGIGASNWSDALQTLHWMTNDMGNCPLDWPAPNGYPDVATAWRSSGTLLDIWGTHLGLVGGWWDGLPGAKVGALYGGMPANSGDAIKRLTKRLTGMTWSSKHLAVLQTFLGESATTPMSKSVLRWWGEPLAAVILDGPHHALR
ncbi:MAG TPA: DUF1800 domain-containing protein [Jatrophihabitans sp.]|nr:DUF1800 domain-containing protein [Jatrophihabitans sp.]